MNAAGTALLLLAGSMLVGLAGIALWGSGTARRAALVERSREGDREPPMGRLTAALDRALRRTPLGRGLALRLDSAGVDRTPLAFVGLCLGAFAVTWVVGSLVLPGTVGVLLGVAAVGGCLFWLARQRERRRFAFVAQLPDIARLLGGGTQAGLSMVGAVELVATELEDPARTELSRVVQELKLGRPLDGALEGLQERLPSREVSVLLTTLIIQQRAGGDVVRALDELGTTLETRKETLREVRTIMSGSVFTSWLVGGMGLGALVLLNLIDPGILQKMTTSAVGLVALAVAGTLYAIGFVFIRQATRIDV